MKPSERQLEDLASRDALLGRAMVLVEPFPCFPEGTIYAQRSYFQCLVRVIVNQMLTESAAATIFERFKLLSPRRSPTPRTVAALTIGEISASGVSRNKAHAIHELALKVDRRKLNLAALRHRSNSEVVRELTEIKGIGVWTAEMFLIFRLGRLDIMPLNDIGIQEGLRRLDRLKIRPTPSEVRLRSASWEPLTSVASWVLWQLADGEAWV